MELVTIKAEKNMVEQQNRGHTEIADILVRMFA